MTRLGYGQGYQYAHDATDALVEQEHLPTALRGRVYYRPVARGVETEIRARLERWRAQRSTGGGAGAPGAAASGTTAGAPSPAASGTPPESPQSPPVGGRRPNEATN